MAHQEIILFSFLWYASFLGMASCCPTMCRCSNTSVYCLYKEMNTDDLMRIAPQIPSYSTKLYLSGNNFEEFPLKALKNLTKLEYLALSFNKMRNVPQNISKYFPLLTELYLTANEIRHLETLHGYENVKTLNLDQNFIEGVAPFVFKSAKNLKELLLGQNNIRRVYRNSFYGLTSLEQLQLNNNRIEQIDEMAFHSSQNLREIYLHVNKLSKIQNSLFSHLKRLRILYLYDNRIETLGSRAFQGLFVDTLYLSSNKITTIQTDTFKNIQVRNMIYVHDNPFLCDCHLIMVSKTSLKNLHDDKKIILGACATPEQFFSRGVYSLRENNNCTICNLKPCRGNLVCSIDENDAAKYHCNDPVVVMTTETTSHFTTSTKITKITDSNMIVETVDDLQIGKKDSSSNNNDTDKTFYVVTGVCVTIGCIIAVLVIWLLYQRRKRKEFDVNNKKNARYDRVSSCHNTSIDLKNVTPTKASETEIFITDGDCV